MGRVTRSRQAEEDLLSIAQYISRDNPPAAMRWLDGIEAKLTLLAKNREMGERVDRIRPGLRRSSYGKYAVFYETEENGIVLIRVLHSARRIEDLI